VILGGFVGNAHSHPQSLASNRAKFEAPPTGTKVNAGICPRAEATFGTFFGEVIEVFEDGAAGTVLITGDQENEVDTFTGTVAEFQASGEWRLLEG